MNEGASQGADRGARDRERADATGALGPAPDGVQPPNGAHLDGAPPSGSSPGGAIVRRRGAKLPTSAPQAMRLVFDAGCVSARQAGALWPGRAGEQAVRLVLRRMHENGLLERERWRPEFSPANARWLGLPPSSQGPLRWEDLFSLSPDGLRWMADHLQAPFQRVRSRYNRSYSGARRDHTYLRLEAWVLISQGACGGRGRAVVRLESEGGIERVRLPDRPGRGPRFVEPDGLFEFREAGDPGAATTLVLLESDTGTQRGVNHLGEKIEAYCEWYLTGGSPTSDLDVSEAPPVLFVSPTRARSAAVLKTFVAAYRSGAPYLRELHARRKQEGFENGARDIFCATNLQILRERGGWGDAYRYLSDERPGPLL